VAGTRAPEFPGESQGDAGGAASRGPIRAQRLDGPGFAAAREELALLLVDAVDSGASVGFLPPFGLADAARYWDGLKSPVERGEEQVFGVRGEDGTLDGCVVLALASMPNQTHRADVKKLLVHRRARRRGLGRALMEAVESEARRLGRTTLVLDTLAGHPSERFYRELGWTEVGRIDRYARVPGGGVEPTVVFARWL
jgi:acetyltransferase